MQETYESAYIHGWWMSVGTNEDEDDGATEFRLLSDNGQPIGGMTLSKQSAIRLAVDLLKEHDPDRLAATPFVDLPNGTFLRRYVDGQIAQVVPTPESGENRDLEDNNNWVRFADGGPFVAVQDASDPAWAVLDDSQVEVKTTWRFKQ